ncbi:hypothetical protein E4V51_20300, partial [Paenibacillus sp. 28ISP30-2]|nr:hypothetical protein [Paenibacillus sp. 28ISP30-2]
MSERIREIKERFAFNLKLAESTGFTGAEYKDIRYLLDFVDSLQQQVQDAEIDSQDWEDEYHKMKRRFESADKSGLETVELLKDASKQLAERDRTIAQLQEINKLHTSGAKQLTQDLNALRVDRDKLQESLEQVQ